MKERIRQEQYECIASKKNEVNDFHKFSVK